MFTLYITIIIGAVTVSAQASPLASAEACEAAAAKTRRIALMFGDRAETRCVKMTSLDKSQNASA